MKKSLLLLLSCFLPCVANIYIVNIIVEGRNPQPMGLPTTPAGDPTHKIRLPHGKHIGNWASCYEDGWINIFGHISELDNESLGSTYSIKYCNYTMFFYLEDNTLFCVTEDKGTLHHPIKAKAMVIPRKIQTKPLGNFRPDTNYWVDLIVEQDCSIHVASHEPTSKAK